MEEECSAVKEGSTEDTEEDAEHRRVERLFNVALKELLNNDI